MDEISSTRCKWYQCVYVRCLKYVILCIQLPERGRQHIIELFELSIDEGLKFLKEHASELSCPVPGISAVKTLCHVLLAFLDHIMREGDGFVPNSAKLGAQKVAEESSSSVARQTLAGIYIPNRHLDLHSKSKSAIKISSSHSSLPYLQRHPECLLELLGKLFVFAFTWAFGGCFETSRSEDEEEEEEGGVLGSVNDPVKVQRGGTTARLKFDALVHRVFTWESNVKVNLPLTADLIYSYYVDIKSGSFVPWKSLVPTPKELTSKLSLMQKGLTSLQKPQTSAFIDPDLLLGSLLAADEVGRIPTAEGIRLTFLAALMLLRGDPCHVLTSGGIGVGKTQFLSYLAKVLQSPEQCHNILRAVLAGGRKAAGSAEGGAWSDLQEASSVAVHSVYASANTQVAYLQSLIESKLVRTGKSISAAPGRKVAYNACVLEVCCVNFSH